MSATDDLNNYIAAKATLRVARPKTRLHNIALQIVLETKDVEYDVPVPCLLCRQSYPMTTTIERMAEWVDSPRGICKACDADSVSVTLVTVDR